MPSSRHRPLHRARGRVGRRALGASAVVVAVAALAPAVVGSATAQADAGYTQQELHFAVRVGPDRAQACDVVGLLFTPNAASSTNRVPAILTTNGFGGSAGDQVPFAQREAALGYVVLSYSGLGFGGSGCKITLDDPDYDGVAAGQLVSYLGGASGIAFLDAAHTQPAAVLNVVRRDAVDHLGRPSTNDPRVGMWGGSYGGQIQFAAASVDPRIDAINPQITWNDLSYSLDPNNTGQTAGVSTATPGATKSSWAAGFSAIGIFDGAQYGQNDPSRLIGCPNFAAFVCPALAYGGATGYLDPASVAALRHASVATYLPKIRIPVLLDQGQTDTLFNLNEAVATYRALKAQGTPVWMLWREQGHSGGTPTAAGLAYENLRIQNFLDHYLKNSSVAVGSQFAYYRDWTGTWAEAPAYPVGSTRTYYLNQGGGLTTNALALRKGTQSFLTPPAGAPTTLGDLDALGSVAPVALDVPDANAAGTFSAWRTPALTTAVRVVGAPVLNVKVSAPTAVLTSALGPAGQLVVFAKIYDIDQAGQARLIKRLVAPVRIPDPTKPVKITLPAFAHRFEVGHRIQILLAGGDTNYRGGLTSTYVTVTTGGTGQSLVLPVV